MASDLDVSDFSACCIFSFAFCDWRDCHSMRCFSLRVFISSWYFTLSSSSWFLSVVRILKRRSICSWVIDGRISNQYCFSLLSIDSLHSMRSTSAPYWTCISSRIVKVKLFRIICAICFYKKIWRNCTQSSLFRK